MDYEEASVAEDLSEDIPNTVLFDVTHTIVIDGQPKYRVFAQRAETYEKKKQTILREVLFREMNQKGEVITEGLADSIVYYTDSEDAQMRGNIEFYSATEETQIEANSLTWENEPKVLKGDSEETVYLEKKNGSKVRGKGFQAELKKKSLRFTGEVEGVFVEEEE
jgi:LPS export ABC transporter protein LptC